MTHPKYAVVESVLEKYQDSENETIYFDFSTEASSQYLFIENTVSNPSLLVQKIERGTDWSYEGESESGAMLKFIL